MEYTVSNNNIHIKNSYKIHKKDDMKNHLEEIKNNSNCKLFDIRTVSSMIEEWRTHNLCYDLHILRNRTADVDINTPNKFWLFMYKICSLLYIA